MSNTNLISNMNYRRRFNEINKEPFTNDIQSAANHDATPTFLYAMKLFILAYFCMIGIDMIYNCFIIIKMKVGKKNIIEEPNSPDMTPPTPPTTPIRATKLNRRPKTPPAPKKAAPGPMEGRITRSQTARRRKKGLDLFA